MVLSNGRSRLFQSTPQFSAYNIREISVSELKNEKKTLVPPVRGKLLVASEDLERENQTSLALGAKMVAQDLNIDLNKALVSQVGHLGEYYQEWIHKPIVSKEGPRFFENDLLEFLTRNEWWVIPLIWFPVVCWFESMSMQMGHDLPQIALIIVTGIFIWTLMEYTLHRFLFHIKTKSYWGNTLHYLLHGCHHKHPQDAKRLVFPPTAAAIILVLLWNMVKLISTPSVTPGLVGGILLGYVMYDVTHYYLHHGQPKSGAPQHLKRYHLNHHFRLQTMGYGITSSFWDRVFGTLPEPKSAEKSR